MLHAKLDAARRDDTSSFSFRALGGWLSQLPACATAASSSSNSKGAVGGRLNLVVLDASKFMQAGIAATLAHAGLVDSSTVWIAQNQSSSSSSNSPSSSSSTHPPPSWQRGDALPGVSELLAKTFHLTKLSQLTLPGDSAPWVAFRLRIPHASSRP